MVHIKKINEITNKKTKAHILSEGVRYDQNTNTFIFDFEHDNETDIIKLEEIGETISLFGHCVHYGYSFSDDVDSNIRTKFIKQIKFPESFENNEDLSLFISKAVGYLNTKITLPQYNVIVYPQSLSELNRKTISAISRITTTKLIEMELVKELPSKIEFDKERFETIVFNKKNENGELIYKTNAQRNQLLKNVDNLMEDVHKLDYFSIARNVKRNLYKPYFKNYYKFKDETSQNIYKELSNKNVIVLDDITTTGTTILNLLNTLRVINDENNIVVFTLIGDKKIPLNFE